MVIQSEAVNNGQSAHTVTAVGSTFGKHHPNYGRLCVIMANRQSVNNAENEKEKHMKPSEIITYLSNLADDFDLQQRHSESIYLREAAALVASHTSYEISRLTMTLGEQVFDLMTEPAPAPVLQTTWERLGKK